MAIRFSKKHGVNPSLEVCFWCGEPMGVALLGKLKGDAEAPREICTGYEMCDKCKEHNKTMIHMIEASTQPLHEGQPSINPSLNAYPTGRNFWIKDEALKQILKPESFEATLKCRSALLEPDVFNEFANMIQKFSKDAEQEETAEANETETDNADEDKADTSKAEANEIVLTSVYPSVPRKAWKCAKCGAEIRPYSKMERRRVRKGGKVQIQRICDSCHNKCNDENNK